MELHKEFNKSRVVATTRRGWVTFTRLQLDALVQGIPITSGLCAGECSFYNAILLVLRITMALEQGPSRGRVRANMTAVTCTQPPATRHAEDCAQRTVTRRTRRQECSLRSFTKHTMRLLDRLAVMCCMYVRRRWLRANVRTRYPAHRRGRADCRRRAPPHQQRMHTILR